MLPLGLVRECCTSVNASRDACEGPASWLNDMHVHTCVPSAHFTSIASVTSLPGRKGVPFAPDAPGNATPLSGTVARGGIERRRKASFRGSRTSDPFPTAAHLPCPQRILFRSCLILVGTRTSHGVWDAPPWWTSVGMAAFVDVHLHFKRF